MAKIQTHIIIFIDWKILKKIKFNNKLNYNFLDMNYRKWNSKMMIDKIDNIYE